MPDTAILLAESPSVKINVQSNDLAVPASLASSNFGMPEDKKKKLLVNQILHVLLLDKSYEIYLAVFFA